MVFLQAVKQRTGEPGDVFIRLLAERFDLLQCSCILMRLVLVCDLVEKLGDSSQSIRVELKRHITGLGKWRTKICALSPDPSWLHSIDKQSTSNQVLAETRRT